MPIFFVPKKLSLSYLSPCPSICLIVRLTAGLTVCLSVYLSVAVASARYLSGAVTISSILLFFICHGNRWSIQSCRAVLLAAAALSMPLTTCLFLMRDPRRLPAHSSLTMTSPTVTPQQCEPLRKEALADDGFARQRGPAERCTCGGDSC